MVTKLTDLSFLRNLCSVLAKIHMVTKQSCDYNKIKESSVLAKIHMVTKLKVMVERR